MSILERREKGSKMELPKIQSGVNNFRYSAAGSSDFVVPSVRQSWEEVKLKGDGCIEFCDAFPIVTLKDLKLCEKLGAGVSSTVFRCVHLPSGKEFALKSLQYDDQVDKLKLVVAELHALHVLRHPNVVNLFSAFHQDKHIHILMSLVDGGSLNDFIKYCPSVPEDALGRIAWHALQGLLFLRKNHYLHRDLKPSNILISRQCEVMIADFGLARQLRDTRDMTTSFLGSLCYMSPERIHHESYGLKSDVWSLGVIIYQCVLGRFPFGGPRVAFWDLTHTSQEEVHIEVPSNYSREVTDFISCCLQFNVENRHSVEQLITHSWVQRYNNTESDKGLEEWIHLVERLRQEEKRKPVLSLQDIGIK